MFSLGGVLLDSDERSSSDLILFEAGSGTQPQTQIFFQGDTLGDGRAAEAEEALQESLVEVRLPPPTKSCT